MVCDLAYLLMQSTKKHLSKELAKLDWKVEEQTDISKMILSDVRRSSCFSFSCTHAFNFSRLKMSVM